MRIAVIGAGPAGLTAARGLDADVFEEHEEVGLPRHCTSLVSSAGAEAVGVPPEVVVRSYSLLTVSDLAGHTLYFKLRRPVYLLDRPGLELKLAEDVGRIRLGEQVVAASGNYLRTRRGVRGPYDLVIVAEGFARRFAGRLERVEGLPGLQVDAKVAGRPLEDMVVVYNREISRRYFAWIVHIDGEVYRIGLADTSDIPEKLMRLLKLLRAEPVSKPFGGRVLAGPPHRRLVWGRYVLVGDAAGLTKPLSGGGIILAMRSGRALNNALRVGDLGSYEDSMRFVRMRLALARRAYDLMYGRRFVDKALEMLSGEEFVAVDYDDHIKTLAFALATTARGVGALAEALRYSIGAGGDRPSL